MATILSFPPPVPPLSSVRKRDEALSRLLPKFLGILWKHGAAGGVVGGPSANVGARLQIGGRRHEDLFMIHAYTIEDPQDFNPMNMQGVVKVFAAHLVPIGMGDFERFRYWEGRCSILSWRRGTWEDAICAHPADPRTVAHLLMGGLAKLH